MELSRLHAGVLEASIQIVRRGLVLHTIGDTSGIHRETGLVAIQLSGVRGSKS
jgi:hypothetical protein